MLGFLFSLCLNFPRSKIPRAIPSRWIWFLIGKRVGEKPPRFVDKSNIVESADFISKPFRFSPILARILLYRVRALHPLRNFPAEFIPILWILISIEKHAKLYKSRRRSNHLDWSCADASPDFKYLLHLTFPIPCESRIFFCLESCFPTFRSFFPLSQTSPTIAFRCCFYD